jgi:hypothetical protein
MFDAFSTGLEMLKSIFLAGSVLGDALAQYATDLPFDAARNLRLSMYGLLVGGPSGHYWHAFLDSRIMPKRPQSLGAVFGKLAADQLVFAPISTAIFLAYLKAAEGYPSDVLPFLQVRFKMFVGSVYVTFAPKQASVIPPKRFGQCFAPIVGLQLVILSKEQ